MGYTSILNFGSQELGLHYVEMKVSWSLPSQYCTRVALQLPFYLFINNLNLNVVNIEGQNKMKSVQPWQQK